MTGSLRHLQLKRTVFGDNWAVLTIAQDDDTIVAMALPRVFASINTDLLVPEALIRLTGQVHRTVGGLTQIAVSTVREWAA